MKFSFYPYRFLITLIHPRTKDEQAIVVSCIDDSFAALMTAVDNARSAANLQAYRVFESLQLAPCPF